MKKIIITAIIGSLIGLFFFIPQQFVENIINAIYYDNNKKKNKNEKKLNEFYKPLDILLTSSYNEWKYLNKHNKTLSFWSIYSFKKSSINFLPQYDKDYKLVLGNIKVTVKKDLIILYGPMELLDTNKNILGKGLYSQILRYKKIFLFKQSAKKKKEIYKIEIFLPYLKLDSVTTKNKTKSMQIPKFPSIVFTIGVPKNIKNKDKFIVESIVKVYSTSLLNTRYLSQTNFHLQAESKDEFIFINLTKEKRDKWVRYMSNIFKPYHEKLEKLIYEKQYLVEDRKMKQLLDRLLFHINGYKIVFKQWKQGDYSRLTSDINFPSEINKYTKEKIIILEKLSHSE